MTDTRADAGPPRGVISNVIRGSRGDLIEWYDWYAYTAFAIYFSKVFFPSGSPTAQLLNTPASSPSASSCGRSVAGSSAGMPTGSARRAALTLSVTMMAAGSLVIAVCPGYSSIGTFAPTIRPCPAGPGAVPRR